MELTVGPVLFEWKKAELLSFYDEVAAMDVDTVYVGEVVCQRKARFGGLGVDDIAAVAEKLQRAGKKVVVSSLAVVSNEDELELTRKICSLPYAIEANDMAVFNIVDAGEKEVIAGPHITSYNVPSIEFLKSVGVGRVVFPVELSGESVRYCIKETGISGEVFAHGKAPLAFSWRCYTSRSFGLKKSECRHDCIKDPEGMELKTMEGTALFAINGTSVLSAGTYSLVEFTDELEEAGVRALRISPQYKNTAAVVEIFRSRLTGKLGPEEAAARLRELSPTELCNGWYAGGAGRDYNTHAGL